MVDVVGLLEGEATDNMVSQERCQAMTVTRRSRLYSPTEQLSANWRLGQAELRESEA
ncbi:MAG: hypothetical protein ACE5JL_12780 [Dehalococcoidia bacterium]